MPNNKPLNRATIHHAMAWDTRIAIGLFVLCIVGPAVMTTPSFWAWMVTIGHVVALILFYFTVKHIGRRSEREEQAQRLIDAENALRADMDERAAAYAPIP